MRLAVIADIHGCLPPLEAVLTEVLLADKASWKVERLFTLPVGDPGHVHLQTRRAVLTTQRTVR